MKTATISVRSHAPVSMFDGLTGFLTEPFISDSRLFLTIAIVAGTFLGSPIGLLV